MNNIKKEVNIYDRILCCLLAATVASAFVLCAFRPITACAFVEADDIATDINNFYEDLQRELDRIEQAIASDINNGNIDASTALGREYMSVLAIQAAVANDPALYTAYLLAHAYNDGTEEANKFISYLQNNPSITFSGTGGIGLYKISGYNDIRIANMHFYNNAYFSEGTIPLITSNDFEVYFKLFETSTYSCTASITAPYYTFSCGGNWWSIAVWTSNNCGFSDYRGSMGPQSGRYVISSSIPVLSSIPSFGMYDNNSICGNVVSEDLPENSCPIETPWVYYNETVLPYMQTNFPNVPTNYYVFPRGYHEAEPDPTEPPLPDGNNGGMTVNNNWNFNIGINNITVTDASGQPVTDASGETVTETVIETETRPSDAVYHFQIPTLTPLETQVATIPPYEVPSEYAGYMSDMFSAITDFIDDAGLSSIAPVFLTLAGIGLVIGVLL